MKPLGRSHLPRSEEGFLQRMLFDPERPFDPHIYPFNIPSVAALETLRFHPRVTFLVGENGGELKNCRGLARAEKAADHQIV